MKVILLSLCAPGIGEASFLALTSHYQTQAVVSMWSSGTGFAGVFGYAWIVLFTSDFALDLSFTVTMLAAMLLAILLLVTYFSILSPGKVSTTVEDKLLETVRNMGSKGAHDCSSHEAFFNCYLCA